MDQFPKDNSRNVSLVLGEIDPPPYLSSPSSTPSCPPPPYSLAISSHLSIKIGKLCVLSVAGGIITAREGKVRIVREDIKDSSQKWKIESAYGRFGFRNQSSGQLLGIQFLSGSLVASKRKLKHWSLFALDPISGGFAFRIPAYWIWIESFLVQSLSADCFRASGARKDSTIIYITYTSH